MVGSAWVGSMALVVLALLSLMARWIWRLVPLGGGATTNTSYSIKLMMRQDDDPNAG